MRSKSFIALCVLSLLVTACKDMGRYGQDEDLPKDVQLNNKGIRFIDTAQGSNDKDTILKMAILYFDSAIKLNPMNYMSYANESKALRKLGRYDEAVVVLQNMLSVKYYPVGVMGLGMTYEKAGKIDQAKLEYQEALRLFEKKEREGSATFNDTLNMAFTELLLGNKERAIAIVEKQLEKKPDNRSLLSIKDLFENFDREELLNGF